MTEQWKAIGDKWPQPAMVWVMRADENNCARIINGGERDWLPIHFLHPMPPTITPEQQAVLMSAVRQNTAARAATHNEYLVICNDTNIAVDDLIAAQQPANPVKELREAWNKFISGVPSGLKRMEAAIAALEGKS